MCFCYKIKDKVYPTVPNTLICLVPMSLHFAAVIPFRSHGTSENVSNSPRLCHPKWFDREGLGEGRRMTRKDSTLCANFFF